MVPRSHLAMLDGTVEDPAVIPPLRSTRSGADMKVTEHTDNTAASTRRKVRSLCENLRDQYLSTKAPHWTKPTKSQNKALSHIQHRRYERRLYGELVYVCTERHTSTPDHQFNPVVETQNIHHRKPKWAVDKGCRSTWFAVTLHVTVMVIIVASVITFIVDSLNYEYCMNECPQFDRAPDNTIVNCSLSDEEKQYDYGCNPANNTGVPCDKDFPDDSIFANSTLNYYCSYHIAKGILGDDEILYLDIFFTIVFTLELLVRAVVAESYCAKRRGVAKPSTPFFADGLNWCDFLAILPLPMLLILRDFGIDNSLRTEALKSENSAGALSSLAILLELFKLLRVVRVFKIARHFSGTRVMCKTVQKSLRPFRLTFIVLFLVFTVLGSALMLVEPCFGEPGSDDCQFPDLFTAGYFLMITILTVGYGDQTPKTDVGRLIGILCMILGSCFLAMPLAIVGNKFQAAYSQEQMESQKQSGDNEDHITKTQRRQRMLNEGFILLGTIDHLQRVVDNSEEQRDSAIGNLYKTHQVLAKDMAVLFPSLKPQVEALVNASDEEYGENIYDDADESRCHGCCRAADTGVKVVPIVNGGGEGKATSSPPTPARSNKRIVTSRFDEQRTAAVASKKCRDKLWLFMEVHDSGKCPLAGYVIRHLMVILALLTCILMMFHELNRWSEDSPPCQRVTQGWCDMIHSLPATWVYEADPNLDASGRFVGYTKAQLLEANPICGVMTCTNGLICTSTTDPTSAGNASLNSTTAAAALDDDDNSANSDGVELEANLVYPGCTDAGSCFTTGTVNRTQRAAPVRCPREVESETTVVTSVSFAPTYQEVVETTTTATFDTNRKYVDYSTLSTVSMWDNIPVCERLVCHDNSEIQYFMNLTQTDLSSAFGAAETFFCCWFLGEFLLRLAACRSLVAFIKSVANWLEFACAFIAFYELILICVKEETLQYEVWGMPLFAEYPYDHVRPLRLIVPLRFLLMSRSYSGADVLIETARKAAPKLAIPVFFLVIMVVIFAGVYFAVETQMDCHVEKVFSNPYDPDAYVFQYVRDGDGTKCDLQDILDGMWLTIVTLTSVGYGRFYPRNISGQILSMLVGILGAFYMAMPLAIVGTTFYSAYKLKEEAKARIHVKRKFKNAVGMVRHFIRQGKLDMVADDSSSNMQTQSGLYREEVVVLGDYVKMLGSRQEFSPTSEKIGQVRRMHVITMNILGHMLATDDLDNEMMSKGMFGG